MIAKCEQAECDRPATCVAKYEAMKHFELSCDECCGHGCEDGVCYELAQAAEVRAPAPPRPATTYVVAWDVWQFRHWCRQHGAPALLVERTDHLRGTLGPKRGGAGRFVVLPGANRRVGFADIVQAANIAGFEVQTERDPEPEPQLQREPSPGRRR